MDKSKIKGFSEEKSNRPVTLTKANKELQTLNLRLAALEKENADLRSSQKALQDAAQQHADLYNFAPVGFVTFSDSGSILTINDALSNTIGEAKENLIGKPLQNYIAFSDREKFLRHTHGTKTVGELIQSELCIIKKDKTILKILFQSRIVKRLKKICFYQGNTTDISSYKEINNTNSTEQQVRQLVESTKIIAWERPANSHSFSYVSQWAQEILGYPISKWHNDGFFRKNIVHPDDLEYLIKQTKEQSEANDHFELEYRLIRKDGKVLWFRDIIHVKRNVYGQESIKGFLLDITEQKLSDLKTSNSEQNFRKMTAAIGQVFWMSDILKSQIIYISSAYEEIWGRSCSSLYEKPQNWLASIHPDDVIIYNEATSNNKKNAQYDIEYRIIRPDGHERWIHDRAFPISGESGKINRMSGVAEDITEVKHAEIRRKFKNEITHLLSKSASVDDVINYFLKNATELFHWEVGEFWEVSPPHSSKSSKMSHSSSYPIQKFADFLEKSKSLIKSDPAMEELMKSPKVTWIPDLKSSSAFHRKKLAAKASLKSAIILPLSNKDQLTRGAIFFSQRPTQPDIQLIQMLENLGEQISQFIDRKAIEEKLLDALEFNRIVIGGAQAGIVVWDSNARFVVWNPYMEEITGYHAKNLLGKTTADSIPDFDSTILSQIFDRVIKGEIFSPPDIQFHLPLTEKQGWLATRFAPWKNRQQEIVGVMAAIRNVTDRRRLEAEILQISDHEKQRIGQDLHDDICQQLMGIEFRLEALALKFSKTPDVRTGTEDIGELLRKATKNARSLAQVLSPVIPEPEGLMIALQGLAAHTELLFSIKCTFRCQDPVLVYDFQTAAHLYRIAQESITNAVKHGLSKNISIDLFHSNHKSTLSISDNGIGLPFPTNSTTGKGMGIRIMQYRSDMIGGTLQISKNNKNRVVITCSFNNSIHQSLSNPKKHHEQPRSIES